MINIQHLNNIADKFRVRILAIFFIVLFIGLVIQSFDLQII